MLLGGLRADGRSSPSRAAEVGCNIYLSLSRVDGDRGVKVRVYVRLSCDSSSYDHGLPATRTSPN